MIVTYDSLDAICNHLSNVMNELHDLETNIYDDEEEDYFNNQFDRVVGSLQMAMLFVETLQKEVEKEDELLNENETLRQLYKEYELVRNLIGSEE